MTTPTPPIASTNTAYVGGPLHVFEAADDELLACGVAEPEELPARRVGSKVWFNRKHPGVGAYRMADGRVRFTIRADIARSRDTAFVGLLAQVFVPAVVRVA